jgi:hypothetical protein
MISTNLLRSRSTIAAIAGALIALVALFGSTAQAAPQISNGSFEAGISQWTVDFGDVDVVSGWQAADGSQSIDLNGSSATPPRDDQSVFRHHRGAGLHRAIRHGWKPPSPRCLELEGVGVGRIRDP